MALRFARVLRYRDDKPPSEADTIERVPGMHPNDCVTACCNSAYTGPHELDPSHRRAADRRCRAAPAREKEILAATRALFDARGVRDAQIEDIARAVGINRAIIYRHFAGKEELFALTLVGYLDELDQALQPATAEAPPSDRLRR